MNTVSISHLKTNPSRVISQASDFPISVSSRNKTLGYLVGKDLFEKMILMLEDKVDQNAVEADNINLGKDFESITSELGI